MAGYDAYVASGHEFLMQVEGRESKQETEHTSTGHKLLSVFVPMYAAKPFSKSCRESTFTRTDIMQL